MILPVSEKYNEYAKKVCNLLNNCDIRASIDDRNETIGKKIRENEMKRIPYLLVVGEKEEASETVSVRKQGGDSCGEMKTEAFAALVNEEVKKQLA